MAILKTSLSLGCAQFHIYVVEIIKVAGVLIALTLDALAIDCLGVSRRLVPACYLDSRHPLNLQTPDQPLLSLT